MLASDFSHLLWQKAFHFILEVWNSSKLILFLYDLGCSKRFRRVVVSIRSTGWILCIAQTFLSSHRPLSLCYSLDLYWIMNRSIWMSLCLSRCSMSALQTWLGHSSTAPPWLDRIPHPLFCNLEDMLVHCWLQHRYLLVEVLSRQSLQQALSLPWPFPESA